MTYRAWGYIYGVLLMAVALTAYSSIEFREIQAELPAFVVLVVLCTLAQLSKTLFQSKLRSEHGTLSYSPALVFLFAGILLLQPILFVLLVLIPHVIEWGKERWYNTENLPTWYIQPFNIATHVVAGLAAQATFVYLFTMSPVSLPSPVFAMTMAALVYVFLNHLLVGQALVLARHLTWHETGILTPASILPDLIMLCLGYALATLWKIDPWMILAVLAPLGLVQRALMVPQLQQEVKTDAKTGLLTARYFARKFADVFEQVKRQNQPLSLVMGDLDLLRDINNRYGHLAGDAVLAGIGEVMSRMVRDGDLAARFGGEEFALVLPNTDGDQALMIVEQLRAEIVRTPFLAATMETPIHATMSFGVASFPDDATTMTDLMHQADLALYQAKYQGRNRTVCAAQVAQAVTVDVVPHNAQPFRYREPTSSMQRESAAASSGVNSQDQRPRRQKAVAPSLPQPRNNYLAAFVGATIIAGLVVTITGWRFGTTADIAVICLLALVAAGVELFQINVYGPNTTSVSVAIAFAAALLGGFPGLAMVSAAIAGTHYVRRRPELYKLAFNWATHVLAGTVPAVIMLWLNEPIHINALPALALPLIITAVAYYAIDTGLVAFAISLALGRRVTDIWQEQFRWLAWHYLTLCVMGMLLTVTYQAIGAVSVLIFILPVLMMHFAQKQYISQTDHSMRELRRLNGELSQANAAVVQVIDELFLTLAKIFDARDPYVSTHAAQVAHYAVAIASELGIAGERLDQVRQAGYLHDIGKMAIPESILHKPSKLTESEYALVKLHAELGAEFVETSQGLRHLAPFIRHHHERWDGQGYPAGLTGEEIPLEARILSVADAVEAMAADRPYHRGMSVQEIIAEVRQYSGTQFDPAIAAVFIRLAEREGDALVVNSARAVEDRYMNQDWRSATSDVYVQNIYAYATRHIESSWSS